jgi:hypothetical protein
MSRKVDEKTTKARAKNYSALEREVSELKKVWQENYEIKFDFILTEIDLALTFFRIARSSQDQGKVERNLRHARAARQSAIRYLEEAPLSKQRETILREKLEELDRRYPPGQKLSPASP